MTRSPIIDGHVHVYLPPPAATAATELEELPFPIYSAGELLALMHESGVSRANLIQKKQWRFDNSYILEAIEREPGRFVGTAVVDVRSRSMVNTVGELHRRGIRAIRIHPQLTDSDPRDWLRLPEYHDLYRLCGQRDIVVSAMVGPTCFAELDRMSEAFPDTPVVIDHMGSCFVDMRAYLRWFSRLLDLARHSRIYVKLSGFYSQGMKTPPYYDLEEVAGGIVKAFGPKRCLWGSDGPYQLKAPHSYAASLDFIRRLPGLADDDRAWILGKTAEELLFKSR